MAQSSLGNVRLSASRQSIFRSRVTRAKRGGSQSRIALSRTNRSAAAAEEGLDAEEPTCDIHSCYKWLTVPSNDKLCPPSKKSYCNLIQRLDFNAYNPIGEFEALYKDYTTIVGGIITLAGAVLLGGFAYFTIADQLQNFNANQVALRATSPSTSLTLQEDSFFFGFVNSAGSAVDTTGSSSPFTTSFYQCANPTSSNLSTCTAISTQTCTVDGMTGACPNTPVVSSASPDNSFVLATLAVSDPTLATFTGGSFQVVVVNPGNGDLKAQEGQSLAGLYKSEIKFDSSLTKELTVFSSPHITEFERRYQFGSKVFDSFRTDIRRLNFENFGSYSFSNIVTNPLIGSNLVLVTYFRMASVETQVLYQQRSMLDALSKIGGAAAVVFLLLFWFSICVTKKFFRRARAFEPDYDSFKRLLLKKQQNLRKFQGQLKDMKRPLEELGIRERGEDLKKSKALEDFMQYLQDKEVHEMCLYKQSLKRAFVLNLDDYDDPLRDIDLSILYPNAKEHQNLSLDPTRSHRRDQELRLNNVLNNLSLKSIEKQLNILQDFLQVVREDMTAQLQKIVADDDLDGGGPLRLPGQ